MATITSTIKLVDQMTPTLNKISKAIDRVNSSSKSVGSAKTWSSFNSGAQTATKHTHNLYNALRRAVFIIGSIKSLQGFAQIADTMMSTSARIDNINDGLYTTSQYMDMIYQSAQRARADFTTMAASVSKLGTLAGHAFSGMGEIVGFTELMNKLFVISGSSAAEASNAMYQLTQAMAAGKLQGDEMRSILENAPMLAQKIADKMGVAIGEVKQLGADGKITAEIIKEALFESADEIEKRFEKMPKTIGQIWTEIKNHAINAFRPVIDKIQKIINSPKFNKLKTQLLGIIDSIANGVLRLISAFNSVRVQNAISQICDSLRVLWGVAQSIGNGVANIAIWIADNWSWLGPIVMGVAMAFLAFKAVMLIATAVIWVYNAAMTVMGLITGTIVLTTLGWVVVIILAVIAVIVLAVMAWNHFTDSSVSAVGAVLAVIGWLGAALWDVLVFLWDCLGTIVDGIVYLAKTLWQVFVDVVDFLAMLFTDIVMFFAQLFIAAIAVIVDLGVFLWDYMGSVANVWVWLGKTILQILQDTGEVIANAFIVVFQFICNIFLGICGVVIATVNKCIGYFQLFVAKTKVKFYSLALMAVSSFNNMISSAGEGAKEMLKPFVSLYNKCVGIFNAIANAWNNSLGKANFTIKNPFNDKEYSLGFGKIETADEISVDDVINFGKGLQLNVATNLAEAMGEVNDAQAKINANDITDAFTLGFTTFDYGGVFDGFKLDAYQQDWQELKSSMDKTWDSDSYTNPLDAFTFDTYMNPFDAFDGADYKQDFDELIKDLDQTWNSDNYLNPNEVASDWYDAGAAFESGVAGFVDGIGGILENLQITGGDGFKDWDKEAYNGSGYNIADSLGDLLGGSGGGTLGDIADNTGKSADSTSNIEDTLDLAEEELQLLRKLAEQEVINRFTTAEIHVDMTNNNNISSKMDLDGIVTHLSNKLYEELGVVASGVHY